MSNPNEENGCLETVWGASVILVLLLFIYLIARDCFGFGQH